MNPEMSKTDWQIGELTFLQEVRPLSKNSPCLKKDIQNIYSLISLSYGIEPSEGPNQAFQEVEVSNIDYENRLEVLKASIDYAPEHLQYPSARFLEFLNSYDYDYPEELNVFKSNKSRTPPENMSALKKMDTSPHVYREESTREAPSQNLSKKTFLLQTDLRQLRPDQNARLFFRTIAAQIWKKKTSLSASEMVRNNSKIKDARQLWASILKDYDDETIINWISDMSPRSKKKQILKRS